MNNVKVKKSYQPNNSRPASKVSTGSRALLRSVDYAETLFRDNSLFVKRGYRICRIKRIERAFAQIVFHVYGVYI